MTVLLYAITPAGAPVPSEPGLGGQPLRTLVSGDLQAVVSDHDRPPLTDTNTMLAYEAVMERLMASATVLPARFGTTADDDGEIAAQLESRREELGRSLQQVAGAVEIAVHGSAPAQTADAEPRTGTEYMRARLDERRQQEAIASATNGLYRAREPRRRSTAYLVENEQVSQFVERVTALGATVTGPWPPYSFTGGAAA